MIKNKTNETMQKNIACASGYSNNGVISCVPNNKNVKQIKQKKRKSKYKFIIFNRRTIF
jgi:hypothetical protein